MADSCQEQLDCGCCASCEPCDAESLTITITPMGPETGCAVCIEWTDILKMVAAELRRMGGGT